MVSPSGARLPDPQDHPDTGIQVGLGLAVFFSLLAVYVETLQPSVPGGDAGELIVEAYQLGLPHPPGYPLHTLLGHAISRHWLFGGDAVGNSSTSTTAGHGSEQSQVAWRLNFLSACFGAGAGMFIYFAGMLIRDPLLSSSPPSLESEARGSGEQRVGPVSISLIIVRHVSAIMGAVGFCLSPLVWTYSVTAEVFSLNNIFSSLIILLTLIFFEKTEPGSPEAKRCAKVGAFISGLGLCNQHSLIFFVVPLGAMALGWASWATTSSTVNKVKTQNVQHRKNTSTADDGNVAQAGEISSHEAYELHQTSVCCSSVKDLLNLAFACGCCFIAGLSLYAVYLPIGTGKRGAWGDGSTGIGMFTHILRREYGTFMLHPDMVSDEGVVERSILYLEHLPSQMPFGSATDIHPRLSRRLNNSHLDDAQQQQQELSFFVFDETLIACVIFFMLVTGAVATVWESMAGRAVGLLWISYITIFHSLSNIDLRGPLTFGVHARFWMQPNVIIFLWGGVGIRVFATLLLDLFCCIIKCFGRIYNSTYHGDTQNRAFKTPTLVINLRQVITIVFIAVLVAFSGKTLRKRWQQMDQHENWVIRDELLEALESLPPNALVLLRGDHITNGMRYLQTCENRRPDVAMFSDQLVKARWFPLQEDKYPHVVFPKRVYITDQIFGFSLEELIRLNIGHRPVFACDRLVTVHIQHTYTGLPWGLCEKVVRVKTETQGGKAFDMWWSGSGTGWQGAKSLLSPRRNFTKELTAPPGFKPDSWEYKIFEKIFERQQATIATMITFAESVKQDRNENAGQLNSSTKVSILKKVRQRVSAILKQDLGPFTVQSATWKNMAVAHLTVPGALQNRALLRGGLRALCKFIKHPSEEVDKDPQIKQVHDMITQVAGRLYQKFNYTSEALEKLGWSPHLKIRGA